MARWTKDLALSDVVYLKLRYVSLKLLSMKEGIGSVASSDVINNETGLVVDLGSLETESVVKLLRVDEEPNNEEAKKIREVVLVEVAIAMKEELQTLRTSQARVDPEYQFTIKSPKRQVMYI